MTPKTYEELVHFLLVEPLEEDAARSLRDRVDEIKKETSCSDWDVMCCLLETAQHFGRLYDAEVLRGSGFVPLDSDEGQAIMRQVEHG